MHKIPMEEFSEEFARSFHAAGSHIQAMADCSNLPSPQIFGWIKSRLTPPFLEHLSFRVGNQLFFIRIESSNGLTDGPGSRAGLYEIANGCKGHACLIPMRKNGSKWRPDAPGWGLLNVASLSMIDPPMLVTDEKIVMTNWELRDFSVQIVRNYIIDNLGFQVMSFQSNPQVDPSIWFIGDHGPEYVVVREARHNNETITRPSNLSAIVDNCRPLSRIGHFAPVAFSLYDPHHPDSKQRPLWRGHQLNVEFQGLLPIVLS